MHRPVTPNTPSRRLPNASPSHDGPAYQTALRGASLAFQRTGPSPGPSPGTISSKTNEALLAATRISRHPTGSSVHDGNHGLPIDHGAVSQRLAQFQAGSPQNSTSMLLKPPGRSPNVTADSRATSFIAATLAASRSASPSPSQVPHAHPYSQQRATRARRKNSAASSVASLDLATDTTSIPPTTALISMFEKSKDAGAASNDTDPIKKPNLRPFTPPVSSSPCRKPDTSPSRLAGTLALGRSASPPVWRQGSKRDDPKHPYSSSMELRKREPPTSPLVSSMRLGAHAGVEATLESGKPRMKAKPHAITPSRLAQDEDPPILSPQPRRTASHRVVRPEVSPSKQPEIKAKKPPAPLPAVKPKARPQSIQVTHSEPIPIRPNPDLPSPSARRPSTTSSNDTFVSASSLPTSKLESPRRGRSPAPKFELPLQMSPQVRLDSTQSMPSGGTMKRKNPVPPPPRRAQWSTTTGSSNMNLNSLTAATMAGIVASSRMPHSSSVPSSPRPPSLPPPRKGLPHLRQTLRKPPSSSDDEESKWKAKHKTKPLQSKKKHSHHEGARKRWREELTTREKRRYEGVWASNRGYLVNLSSPEGAEQSNGTPPQPTPSPTRGIDGDLVVNIVVRDIWSRSRLPVDELAEVWDLVDRTGKGTLDKTEFVVGMWLIDQRLRGRKIPQKVMDSVWHSAQGIAVKGPPNEKKKVKHKH